MFESKNVFVLMYGKNPTFFLLSFVALRNAFATSEMQDHNDICYLLSIWLRYTLLANVLYFVRIDHFHVRRQKRNLCSSRHFFCLVKLIEFILMFISLPPRLASQFYGRDIHFNCKK